MKRRKDSDKKNRYSPPIDRLLVSLLQNLTDIFFSVRDNQKTAKSRSNSISIGYSPNIYRQKLIDEVFLQLNIFARHVYILGQSGSGKTYLILMILMSLVQLGCGFGVIDVHGDLSRMLLSYIASAANTPASFERISKRLVLIEPFDPVYAPGFDLLKASNRLQAYTQAFDMFEIFIRVWKDVAWGPRMKELLRNLLLTLSLTGKTLGDGPLFLIDHEYRRAIVELVPDQDLKFYWTDRFGTLSDNMRSMYVEPVLNKLTVFTSDPLIRHIIAQKDSSIDFRKLMDQQKWVIINVSKGTLSQNAHLLGSLFTSKIKSAAMSRVDISENLRVPFYYVVDEFQNFMGYNFEEILSEARKYRLSLILAHQNLAQIEKTMREAIFGNVGTILLFKLGHNDINDVIHEFARTYQDLLRQTLSTLNTGEVVRREPDGSFRKVKIHHISPPKADIKVLNQLRACCREKYYRKRSDIDLELARQRSDNQSTGVILSSPKLKVKHNRSGQNEELQEGRL